ncbi:MAG TPA: ankyrin repeat domain-containing protein [Amycolatopsis sp.]|nr:ankyrin repeat domain-containing protein [Amycolatopsis sp.]
MHQAAYRNLPLLADLLLAAGAPVDVAGRGDGGTPLVVALFWGHAAMAEKLARHGEAPRNLRVAAGLGDAALLDELVRPNGTLAPAAGAHHGFYRPHGGFPSWRPSDDAAEIRDEALAWAARNDRTTALRTLAARGANLDADVYRGTALTWAAAQGKLAAVRTLLELGADVNRAGTFGGPSHGVGVTAAHLAAENNHPDVLQALVAAGADLDARDGQWHATPETWAKMCGSPEAREFLVQAR